MLSSAANYVVGSILSYFLNKYYTFQYKERSLGVIVRFVANIAVCYTVAYGIAKPIIRQMLADMSISMQENAAMLVGMCLFVVFNYIGQHFSPLKKMSIPSRAKTLKSSKLV